MLKRYLVCLLLIASDIAAAEPGAAPAAAAPAPPASEPLAPFSEPLVVGALAGSAGMFAAAGIGIATLCRENGCDQDIGKVLAIGMIGAVGLTIGTTTGVTLAGRDRRHTTSVAATWLGSATGVGTAFLLGRSGSLPVMIMLACGTSSLGATLGMRLTYRRRAPAPALQILPMAGEHHTGLSVVGAF